MPSIAVTRQYEAIYILRPDSTEEQVETTVNKYRQIVQNNGGNVGKIDRWERRKLAYEIAGCTEGLYIIMEFGGESRTETELRRNFQISEDQIRYMIVKRDEGEVTAPAARATSTAEAAPASSDAAPAETPATQETQAPVATEPAAEASAVTAEA